MGGAMAKPRDDRQKDLLRPALEDIIDLGHPLVRLAVLAAAGYNFSLLLRWLATLLRALFRVLFQPPPSPNPA